MERLTKTEEPIMQIVWKLEQAFVKDIIAELPDPKPPYNTVSSLVRILVEKGMIGYEAFGRTHRYYPLVSQKEYRQYLIKNVISNYFDNSYTSLVSHILDDQPLSSADRDKLKNYINENL